MQGPHMEKNTLHDMSHPACFHMLSNMNPAHSSRETMPDIRKGRQQRIPLGMINMSGLLRV